MQSDLSYQSGRLTAFVLKLGTIDSCDQALEQLPWLDG
ncbi:hypothetical protein SR187_7965 [Streptococcus ruminantium]|uniref:Uncharacterized protein n=1 Tax=Streptococcus ruminantium TaxID=1917441 RepID=A0A2Z5TPQ1_9STRE|nr:hypothetical protein SR187_7965 [Streptococcus ruminantium]